MYKEICLNSTKKSIGKNVTFYLVSDTFLSSHLIKIMKSVQFGPQNAHLQTLKSKFRFKIKEPKQISLQVQTGTNLHLQW